MRVLSGCVAWLAVLGWIDRATGFELGLLAFYTAPVAVAAWKLGQRPGIIVAFIASVIWYLADRWAGDRYSTPFYAAWNTGMHFTAFLINAVTFAKIKSSLNQRHAMERALLETQQQLKQLPAGITLCARCQEPCVGETIRTKVEEPLAILPSDLLPAAARDGCGERMVITSRLTRGEQFNMLLGQPRSDGVTPETGEPLPGLSGPGANGGS